MLQRLKNEHILILGTSLLLFPFIILTLSHLLFWTNFKLNAWVFPISLILLFPSLLFFTKKWFDKNVIKTTFIIWGITASIIFILQSISGWFVDVSWDGQMYHQDGVIALANGWNPLKEYLKDTGFGEWVVNQFFSSAWIYEANAFLFFGKIETAKFFNIFFALTAFLFSWFTFNNFKPNSKKWNFLFALVLAFNPIFLSQIFTFYVDNQILSITIILISLLVTLLASKQINTIKNIYVLIAISVFLLISLKLPAIGFTVVYLGGGGIYLLIKKRFIDFKKYAIICSVIGIVAVGIYGYHPFIRNVINYGHPFYPMNKLDMLHNAQPGDFMEHNRFRNFIVSQFSYSGAVIYPENSTIKSPLSTKDLGAFAQPDSRTSGFGSLFGLSIIILLITWLYALYNNKQTLNKWHWIAAVLLISVFIHPACWWARYVGQFYIIPLSFSWLLWSFYKTRTSKILAGILLAVLSFNSLLIAKVNLKHNINYSSILHKQLNGLKGIKNVTAFFGCYEANKQRFNELDIQVNHITDASLLNKYVSIPMIGTPLNSTIFYSPDFKIDTVNCSANNNTADSTFIIKNNEIRIESSHKIADPNDSTKHFIKVNSQDQFAITTIIPVKANEYYTVSIKCNKKDAGFKLCAQEPSEKEIYTLYEETAPDSSGWFYIKLKIYTLTTPANGKLKLCIWNSKNDSALFDDIQIIRQRRE